MLDLIIEQATIVDGTGAPAYRGDIGIRDGRIAEIAPKLSSGAFRCIKADGLMAAPGFIDIHSHDDIVLGQDPLNLPKLMQGVTTVVVGNCGFGVAPSAKETRQLLRDYSAPVFGPQISECIFGSFGEYASYLQGLPKAQNIAALLPHGAVYIAVNGFSDQMMSEQQLRRAEAYVAEAMEAGALGMSLGLMYAPGCYSTQTELHRLGKAVARQGGIVCVHMKSESGCFEKSLAEAAELSRCCGVPVQISHLKHVGKEYWGHMRETLVQLQSEMDGGADLGFDMYPYTMGSSTMSILFPTGCLRGGVKDLVQGLRSQAFRDTVRNALRNGDWGDEDNLSMLCGWENVIISSLDSQRNRSCMGKSIQEIARERGVGGEDAMIDLYIEEQGEVAVLLNHIDQQDMRDVILSRHTIPASDGLPDGELPHPRLYGAFAKYLKDFARDQKLLSWEAAVEKITSKPARRFGLGNRGLLREGYAADIVLFDPKTIADTATYTNPRSHPTGIQYVAVGGAIVVENGAPGDARPGKFLKRAPK